MGSFEHVTNSVLNGLPSNLNMMLENHARNLEEPSRQWPGAALKKCRVCKNVTVLSYNKHSAHLVSLYKTTEVIALMKVEALDAACTDEELRDLLQ